MSETALTLYYYEHCPYCVRVRVAAGLLGVKLNTIILQNDDEQTPIGMVGKKLVPILETAPQQYMGESLDIVEYMRDISGAELAVNDEHMAAVNDMLSSHGMAIRSLSMPRWAQIDFAEFATQSAVDYFIKKKTATVGDFATALENTDTFVAEFLAGLEKNSELLCALREQPKSIAAIVLFCGLWGVSSVKGFAWTPESRDFMESMSSLSGVPLLTDKAL